MSKIIVNSELCKGCEFCTLACPKKIVIMGDAFNSKGYRYSKQIDALKCTGCKLCGIVCPESAIEVYK